MDELRACPGAIPYLINGNEKVVLDFSTEQHECSYYINMWNALCEKIQDAHNMEKFPYGNSLFAIGVKLDQEKSYSIILTSYNLYVLGFADFYAADEIIGGTSAIIFNMDAVAYPRFEISQNIDIKCGDLLKTQFYNMYYFWENIKGNQSTSNATNLLRWGNKDGQKYFISFLIVVWFISEAAREETGRIAWLISLSNHGRISDSIVHATPSLRTGDDVTKICNQCPELFLWQRNKDCIFNCWDDVAEFRERTNYILVKKIAQHHIGNVSDSDSIEMVIKKIYKNRNGDE